LGRSASKARNRATLSGPPETATTTPPVPNPKRLKCWRTLRTNGARCIGFTTKAQRAGSMYSLGKILLVRLGRVLAHPWLGGFVLHPMTRYVLAWLFALAVAAGALHTAWINFDTADRPDGNKGHTYIDFGGQWLLAHILVEGRGRHLYDRTTQREV